MMLKRLYDFDAPEAEWVTREEPCETCDAKGVVVNESLDGVEPCPDCEGGMRSRLIPPVVGVEVVRAGPLQKFSPKIVARGQAEGWLSTQGVELVIHGENKTLTYQINRVPGRYEAGSGLEQINYYDCELVEEVEV